MAGVWETAGPGPIDMVQNQDGEMAIHGIVPIHGTWVDGVMAPGIWDPGKAALGKAVPGTVAHGI